jgi:hypothetical protein
MSRYLRKRGTTKKRVPEKIGRTGRFFRNYSQHIETFKLLLVIIGLPASLMFLTTKYSEYEVRQILSEPAQIVGTLTEVGRYTTVEYKVNGNTYSFKRRLPEELVRGRVAGDTAVVIYAQNDPDNAQLKKGFASHPGN